jgi:sugar lactone lactonase YvrE
MNPLLSAMSRYFRRPILAAGRAHTAPRKARRQRLFLEALEDRTVPSTISVTDVSLNEIGNVSAFVAPGSAGLNQPKEFVLGPDGNVYVASATTNSVIRYTPSGQLLGTFVAAGSGGLSNPRAVAFGPDGNLYVSSVTNNNVLEYNGGTGAFLSMFVPAGSGGLNYPSGMVFGQDGNLYVSSCGTESVDRFQGPLGSAPGSPLPASGQSGATFVAPGSGGLGGPNELMFGPNGNLFVSNGLPVGANTNNNYGVLEFDASTGGFITTYVGSSYVTVPRGIAFDQDGRLYVADMSTNAIHRFDSQGNYLDDPVTSSASSLQVPIGMVFDAQGGLLVSSRDGNAVYRYDRGVTVTLSAASASPVSVQYATGDGTATANTDYTPQAGTVTFAPGQTSRLVLLVTNYDGTVDGNEAFSVQLSNPTGATIGAGSATVTIVDPSWPQLSVANTSAIEGDATAHYRGAFAVAPPGVNLGNAVVFNGGYFYTSPGPNTIAPLDRYDASTGAFIDHFIPAGRINGVRTPVFHNGYLYVGSEYTDEVLRYDATTGAPAGASGLPGDPVFVSAGSGGLDGTSGLCFGPDGNLYVTGRNSFNVIRYDSTTGQPLGRLNTSGAGALSWPEGLTIDVAGTVYVASAGNDLVQRYNEATGAYLGAVSSTALASPKDVKIGLDGLLYVLSSGNLRILRFTTGGTYVDDYVPAGSGGMTNNPTRMNFGPDGDLYVVGVYSNNQVYRFGTENEAVFAVSLSAPFAEPVTVNYATADGTAVAGANYTPASGTVSFAPGISAGTIRVPVLDSGSQTTSLTFTVTLSNPQAATLSQSQATGTIAPSDQNAKFYVVNDATPTIGGTNTAFKYQPSGAAQAPFGLGANDLDPRGVAANAAGTTEWVVDANKTVYVYSTGGALLGSWAAGGLSSSAQLTGITTNGADVWLVDSYSDKVYKYTGAASRLSGSQSAASNFSLSSSNSNAADIVTDGTSFWVVDGSRHKVFKYSLSGSSLGSWSIDPANAHPTGITINPANVSDIWIVDNGTLKVYQYTAAASRTSGSQNAAATFAVAGGDTNPQGIADPPPADMLVARTPAPSATRMSPIPALSLPPATLAAPLAAGEIGEFFRGSPELVSYLFGNTPSVAPRSAPVPSTTPSERNPIDPQALLASSQSQGISTEPTATGLVDDAGSADVSPAQEAVDTFFAQQADAELVPDWD